MELCSISIKHQIHLKGSTDHTFMQEALLLLPRRCYYFLTESKIEFEVWSVRNSFHLFSHSHIDVVLLICLLFCHYFHSMSLYRHSRSLLLKLTLLILVLNETFTLTVSTESKLKCVCVCVYVGETHLCFSTIYNLEHLNSKINKNLIGL